MTGFSSMKAMTLRRPPQGQARMSWRKTRRSSSWSGAGSSRRLARTCGWCGARTLRGRRHDLLSPLRGGPEDAVVAHEVSPRRRHQRGETAEQLARFQDEDLAALAEAPLHAALA